MIIEIHGGGFQNKGAHKMLCVTIAELSRRIPNVQFAVDTAFAAPGDLEKLGLLQIWPKRGWYSKKYYPLRLMNQKLCGAIAIKNVKEGRVRLSEVDALVDISGFAYTDSWGCLPTKNFAALTRHYKSRCKPVVLLPQAFGPFGARNKNYFSKVIANSDLIFARDKISYEHIEKISGKQNNLDLAPDITLFSEARYIPEKVVGLGKVAIVPNIRMLRQGAGDWGAEYVKVLCDFVKTLRRRDIKPFILLHDGGGEDLKVAERVSREVRGGVDVVEEFDPWKLKKIISETMFLIGSRYHALIAAYSVGIPSIALGWSHKYAMLCKEFGMEKFMVEPSSVKHAEALIAELADPDTNLSSRIHICNELKKQRSRNKDMWDKVVRRLTE